MADTKISALPASTTPLAGTEVLPVVQSGTTKKVSVADLTAGRAVSMATAAIGVSSLASLGSPVLGAVGGTSYDTNFNINSAFLSDTTHAYGTQLGWNPSTKNGIISSGYGDGVAGLEIWNFNGAAWQKQWTVSQIGNFTQNVALRGFNFTANTAASGMTSQLLNWYEEGTFTPTVFGTTSAGTTTYSNQSGTYTRIGDRVYFEIYVVWTNQTGTGNLRFGGLPFTSNASVPYSVVSLRVSNLALTAGNYPQAYVANNSTNIVLEQVATGGGTSADVPIDTSAGVMLSGCYRI